MNLPEAWVTKHQVAEHLGVTVKTVENWVHTRGLPAHKVGGDGSPQAPVRFKLSEIDDWFRGAAA